MEAFRKRERRQEAINLLSIKKGTLPPASLAMRAQNTDQLANYNMWIGDTDTGHQI